MSEPTILSVYRHYTNSYELYMDGKLVASCPTYEAHNAARWLLGQR